jgi:Mg2+ and Co2+ transporter CorA
MNGRNAREEVFDELLNIEKHEDVMLTSMVKLIETNERLSQRINNLTWVMLALTWITVIISIPNTLATFFGIPKVSEAFQIEIIVVSVLISVIIPVVFLLAVGFDLRKMLRAHPER